jgi:hypothetical protein
MPILVLSKAVEIVELHRITAKLLEFGISEKWLEKAKPTLQEAQDLLKGVLYLREMYPDKFK